MKAPAVFTRIRFRILGIVLLAIIPAVALIYYSAAERKRRISEEIEDNTMRLSRFLASNLERDLSEGKGYLTAVAAVLRERKPLSGDCGDALKELKASASVYANVGLAGRNGNILCSAAPFPSVAGLGGLEWFHKIDSASGYAVGFDFNAGLSSQASIVLVLPVIGRQAHPFPGRHFLFAIMELDWLHHLAESSRLPAGSAISVTNPQGDAVARYPDPDKWVGKARQLPYTPENLTGTEGIRIIEGIDGIRRLYAYTKVAGKGNLVVNVGIFREAMLEPANRALTNQLTALGIVALLAILATWFGSDVFLLKQVRVLIDATKRLGAGNLQARSTLSYESGELGELARAFDEMAETLEWRNAQLRESEHERTNPYSHIADFIEYIPEPILLLNEEYWILAANGEICSLFQLSAAEIAAFTLQSLCPQISFGDCSSKLASDSGAGGSRIYRLRSRTGRFTASGEPISVDISLSKVQVSKKPFIVALMKRTLDPIIGT